MGLAKKKVSIGMIDWKKVAKHEFLEAQDYKRLYDLIDDDHWHFVHEIAKILDVPRLHQLHVSAWDTQRLVLDRLGANVEKFGGMRISFKHDQTELDIRLRQITSRLDVNDDSKLIRFGWFGRLIFRWLIKLPSERWRRRQ